jgi:hypothetical protein
MPECEDKMKYKLINAIPRKYLTTTFGGITYEIDTETYREYPPEIVTLYGAMLEAEPEAHTPKPSKEKAGGNK